MTRVSKKAVFLADGNRFGQGALIARFAKYGLWKLGLWRSAYWFLTKGKGYSVTEQEGVSYSYSVYDSYRLLARWANHIVMIPTYSTTHPIWRAPLFTDNAILLCAFKE